jgi:hypothetical protein
MRLSVTLLPISWGAASSGPIWIGLGLSLLLVNVLWPAAPALTAMGLVACGATGVTAERFRAAPHGWLVVVLNLLVYGGLYCLFVGATLNRGGAVHPLPTVVADLALSLWPMSLVLRQSWHEFQRRG